MDHNIALYRDLLGESELFPIPQRTVAELVETPPSLQIGQLSVAQFDRVESLKGCTA